ADDVHLEQVQHELQQFLTDPLNRRYQALKPYLYLHSISDCPQSCVFHGLGSPIFIANQSEIFRRATKLNIFYRVVTGSGSRSRSENHLKTAVFR
ncbi:hypothetical protein ACJ8PQ_16900, partial [Serratia sp. CY74664]|uniref:hypothetical protein n=1 Tax=Serratia sp. CY74664 TaxID=3383676 RepID=UPI003FA02B31